MVSVRWKEDNTCSYRLRNGHDKRFCSYVTKCRRSRKTVSRRGSPWTRIRSSSTKTVNRCMHGSQDRAPRYNCDDQVGLLGFPIVSADDTKQQIFEEEYSYIENEDGNWTELVLQSNVYWSKAKGLYGKTDSKLLCTMKLSTYGVWGNKLILQ